MKHREGNICRCPFESSLREYEFSKQRNGIPDQVKAQRCTEKPNKHTSVQLSQETGAWWQVMWLACRQGKGLESEGQMMNILSH